MDSLLRDLKLSLRSLRRAPTYALAAVAALALAIGASTALWQKRFGSDPRVIGQSITLTGDSYTVIGVLPPGFRFLVASDVFVPVGLWTDKYKDRDNHPGMSVIARLRAGVSPAQALSA